MTAERKVSGHCLLSKNFRAYAKYALISRLVLSLKNFAFVKRSGTMKAPVGLLSDRTVLRSKMEGTRPDKFQFAVQRQTEEKPLHSKTDAGAFSLFTSR